mgnify:FL=1|tara:strand:+ start:523 stop:1452 length:930 start_codon:yes stop_codon:yes gene_type:complete
MTDELIQTNRDDVYTEFNSQARPWRLYTSNIYHDPNLVTDELYLASTNHSHNAKNNTLNIEASGSDINFYTSDNYKTYFNNNICAVKDVSFNGKLDVSNLEVFIDASFNNRVYISNNLKVYGDVSFNGKLDVSGITTLSDHLLTDSAHVKLPVSYSTFAVSKGNSLTSNLTETCDVWHDLTSNGYMVTISPLSSNSNIKLEFKVNYVCKNNRTISFRVKNNSNDIIFKDLSLSGVTNGVYNGLFIDSNGYNSDVSYSLEYMIFNPNVAIDTTFSTNGDNTETESGILGYEHGNYNIIIAQELYVPVETL